ncbi:MAG: patatin-like phospholipase family protein [Saprospiraceae bacterium]|nr:patatin-like phospholipase family protein [Saprospiraceae bacterium]
MRNWINNFYYSFPVQLIILHLRSNLSLILIWLFLLLLITGQMGRKLGLQYLFLDPEYLGEVNFWSFFFVGLAYGGFFMSWNLTTYLLSAHFFPFLASLTRPFTKFSLNNFVIPISFFLFYSGLLIHFQWAYEQLPGGTIFLNWLGLTFGAFTLILFYSIYFYFTNRDIGYYQKRKQTPPNLIHNIAPGRRKVDLEYIKLDRNTWNVRTYLNESLQSRLVRSVAHYESSLLMNIFKQNHFNALALQLLTTVILLLLGRLIDYSPFRIPAGASFLILLSLINAFVGAITYWFNEWKITIFILLMLVTNFITSFDFFNVNNRAYGLDYEGQPAEYSYETLEDICSSGRVEEDMEGTVNILNNWKQKVSPAPQSPKPKMVVLCVSGGGLKAATWTMQVLQTADSMLNGQLLDHTTLITGASGGMLGTAYLRELYGLKAQGENINIYDKGYVDKIAKDLLNSIAFTIATNDLFLPWSKFEYANKTYHKDRGYVFEDQFNENTDFILDKPLSYYETLEQKAIVPMLYLSPSILNDSRRLIISPQGASFMMIAPVAPQHKDVLEIDAVDFQWLFRDKGAKELRFTTALRANATYPYVLPMVHLPTKPGVSVADAGLRDNYGILSATRFLQVFQDWIRENTSGVVLLQISSSEKIEEIPPSDNKGILKKLFNPIGIAGKVLVTQEFEHDNTLGFIYDILGQDNFQVIRFIYRSSREDELAASVSFHITDREKANVLNAINLPNNQSSLKKLQGFLSKD